MSWLCWALGHRWFRTVISHVRLERWETDDWELAEFEERICLRCKKNQAVYKRALDHHDEENEHMWDAPRPEWMDLPTRHFFLKDGWSSR